MMNTAGFITSISNPPSEKPLMIYDGDCGFCKRWVTRWQRHTQGKIDFEPYQMMLKRYAEIPESQFKQAVHFITLDGSVYYGAEAVFRSLAYPKSMSFWLWLYLYFPLFAWITYYGYAVVARNRKLFSRLMNIFIGKSDQPASYILSRFMFLRGLALVYLCAFLSINMQWRGLFGSHGISPAADLMNAAHSQLGSSVYWQFPTLLLLNSGDTMIQALCAAGMVSSILIFMGISPALFLFIAWVCYLSISNADQTFLSFQWDTLLLETGMLAMVYAPVRFIPSLHKEKQPSMLICWMLYWLLFRLMYGAGYVKLASGDSTWRDLTALNYHYFTQPIPAWTSWYAHHLPDWFQSTSVVIMFIIELGLPFLIFFRGWMRLTAFFGLVGLQVLIALTGNYGFFNVLALVLCLNLIDDKQWKRILPFRFFALPDTSYEASFIIRMRKWITVPFCMAYLFISGIVFSQQMMQYSLPERLAQLMNTAQAFRSVNRYGLFAVMTTTRPEIIIEGSKDGNEWKPYIFYWKPVRLDEAPRFTGPNMPRLDWQMWFAALGNYEHNRWLIQFMGKLLENESDVIALLKENPFQDEPPMYIHAVLYQYEFTLPDERSANGNWWRREQQGLYCPVLTLKNE